MSINRQREINKAISILLPRISYNDAIEIHNKAYEPHMKSLPAPLAVRLAAVAYIRHQYTDYDNLRDNNYDEESARFFVSEAIKNKLNDWHAVFSLQTKDLD